MIGLRFASLGTCYRVIVLVSVLSYPDMSTGIIGHVSLY